MLTISKKGNNMLKLLFSTHFLTYYIKNEKAIRKQIKLAIPIYLQT